MFGGDGGNRTLKCALQRRQFPVSLRPQKLTKLFISYLHHKTKRMVRSAGLEPALTRLEVGGLIQLDDERINLFTSLFVAEIELFVNLFLRMVLCARIELTVSGLQIRRIASNAYRANFGSCGRTRTYKLSRLINSQVCLPFHHAGTF